MYDEESGALGAANSGFAWTLQGIYVYGLDTGHFQNGEVWVVAPAGGVLVEAVTPTPQSNPVRNGSMKNVLGPLQANIEKSGYDDRCGSFDPALVMPIPTPASPWILQADDVVVSTESNPDPAPAPICSDPRVFHTIGNDCGSSFVKRAAVLTVLAAPPPPDAFRPAYAGNPTTRVGLHPIATSPSTTSFYTWSQVDRNALKRLAIPLTGVHALDPNAGELPVLSVLDDFFARVWIDHLGLEINEDDINPTDHMMGYGANQAAKVSLAAVALLETDNVSLGRDDAARELLLKGFLQVGIDSYGVVRGDVPYSANPTALARTKFVGGGGKGGGRLWPILFAGMVFDDDGMQHPPRWKVLSTGPGTGEHAFKEDYQFFCDQDGIPPAPPAPRDWQGSRYRWAPDEGASVYQVLHAPLNFVPQLSTDPQFFTCTSSHQDWTCAEARAEQYRFSSSPAMVGCALAARVMGAFDLLQSDQLAPDGLLGYFDRWMIPMHAAAIAQYDFLVMDPPLQWFDAHWLYPGVQWHGRAYGGTTFFDQAYIPAMWHEHRWHYNRNSTSADIEVYPPDFYTGMPVPSSTVRMPTLVCNQLPIANSTMEFEVYDLPPGALVAAYLGGTADPIGFGYPQPCTPPPGYTAPQPTVYIVGAQIVLTSIVEANEFGYAHFDLMLPPGTLAWPWTIQVLTTLSDPIFDGCLIGSNGWGFSW